MIIYDNPLSICQRTGEHPGRNFQREGFW